MVTNAFLQARVGSTRLPGKVLKSLSGKAMLLQQIDRLRLANHIDNIVVLTSLNTEDDAIELLCKENKINCFRGDLNDVLSRFIQALDVYPCDNIVRITGDCPLLDWDVVDHVISEHKRHAGDYTSNTILPTYPDGLDVEVVKSSCLQDSAFKALKSYEREHVTYYIYQHPESYLINNVINPIGDESNLRWTVDEPEDFEFITEIYGRLYRQHPFSSSDVRALLKQCPYLTNINKGFERNEGFKKSLEEFNNEI